MGKRLRAIFAGSVLACFSILGCNSSGLNTSEDVLDRDGYANISATWLLLETPWGYIEAHDVSSALGCFDRAEERSTAQGRGFTAKCYDGDWLLLKFNVRNNMHVKAEIDLDSIVGFDALPPKKITKKSSYQFMS